MTRPLRLHLPGAIYHVISRGNARQDIFLDDDDREHFVTRLRRCAERFAVRCHGYCLMPNHYHLIVRVGELPVSGMMQQLNGSYTQWFNWRHDRCGHVLQGRPKMPMIEDGEYFRRVLRYVARNPVRARLVEQPEQWAWSSHRAAAGLEASEPWLALEEVWAAFHPDAAIAPGEYAQYCRNPDLDDDAGSSVAEHGVIVGSAEACAALSPHLASFRLHREFAWAERCGDRPSLDDLFSDRRSGDECRWNAAVHRAFDHHGYTLREIADHLGTSPATVWRHARRLATRWKGEL